MQLNQDGAVARWVPWRPLPAWGAEKQQGPEDVVGWRFWSIAEVRTQSRRTCSLIPQLTRKLQESRLFTKEATRVSTEQNRTERPEIDPRDIVTDSDKEGQSIR